MKSQNRCQHDPIIHGNEITLKDGRKIISPARASWMRNWLFSKKPQTHAQESTAVQHIEIVENKIVDFDTNLSGDFDHLDTLPSRISSRRASQMMSSQIFGENFRGESPKKRRLEKNMRQKLAHLPVFQNHDIDIEELSMTMAV